MEPPYTIVTSYALNPSPRIGTFFGVLCHHTASFPITSGTITGCVRPEAHDRIERHFRNGPWSLRFGHMDFDFFWVLYRHTASPPITSKCCSELMVLYETVSNRFRDCNYLYH